MQTAVYYARKIWGISTRKGFLKMLSAEQKRLRKRKRYLPTPDKESLENALKMGVSWLLRAQDASPDAGFPTLDLVNGFGSSYPETSGYIVDTLLTYKTKYPEAQLDTRIDAAVDWLLAIQYDNGGWQSGYVDEHKPAVVFNTGQVMRGLIHAYNLTPREDIAASLDRAADWICEVQEGTGYWATHNYLGVPRVYDTYVAAPLARWAKIRNRHDWLETAERSIQWVIGKQHANGWFPDADNTIIHNHQPILHTIAYTIDGLLEYAEITGNREPLEAGERAARQLAQKAIKNPRLPGRFDMKWRGSEATILTGCAQMSIVWARLALFQPEEPLWMNAKRTMDAFLIHTQWKEGVRWGEMQGAITGSFPFWGKYEPFRCPNWAVKYFCDAMLNHIERIDA